ncbi:hypothetical protein AVEN_159640-1 [Araneus ventricosus]|uniref:Uncharacterized protein n=1 Tax=Araneus ventricosus TaxID=182803 RepID=A0A4Y2IAU1_ARAVE|nr:hypothetical protein AVEN_159640-1 [Araneus ventricosus]
MADNRLFLCSFVPSALLSWPRCAIITNRLFLCSSVSSALLCWLPCPITANRLFLCSSVSSALLSWPRCAIVAIGGFFLLQFQQLSFHVFYLPPVYWQHPL